MLQNHTSSDILKKWLDADPGLKNLLPTEFKDEAQGVPVTITIFPQNLQVLDAIKKICPTEDPLSVFVNEMLHTLDQDSVDFVNKKNLEREILELEEPAG